MKIDDIMLNRCAVACWVSEDANVLAQAQRLDRRERLYYRARAVVVHDRAIRLIDGQPVRQEASK